MANSLGEITIYDGELIVTYGKPNTPSDTNVSAALLAMGSVGDWQDVRVDRDVAPSEIESFIATTANTHGIDTQKSFPFQVRGLIVSYVMHVNAEAAQGPHGKGLPMAATVSVEATIQSTR